MEKILEFGTLPTVLIYEKVDFSNFDNDQLDIINADDLAVLDKKAYQLQKFIDQFENEQAQQSLKDKVENDKPVTKGADPVVPDT